MCASRTSRFVDSYSRFYAHSHRNYSLFLLFCAEKGPERRRLKVLHMRAAHVDAEANERRGHAGTHPDDARVPPGHVHGRASDLLGPASPSGRPAQALHFDDHGRHAARAHSRSAVRQHQYAAGQRAAEGVAARNAPARHERVPYSPVRCLLPVVCHPCFTHAPLLCAAFGILLARA